MRFSSAPRWFQVWMGAWLILGIPSFIIGQGFRGSFSLLPDSPPFMLDIGPSSPIETGLVTLVWLLAVLLIYAPVFALPALLLSRRKLREK